MTNKNTLTKAQEKRFDVFLRNFFYWDGRKSLSKIFFKHLRRFLADELARQKKENEMKINDRLNEMLKKLGFSSRFGLLDETTIETQFKEMREDTKKDLIEKLEKLKTNDPYNEIATKNSLLDQAIETINDK